MLELLTSEQMAEADRLTIKAGTSGFQLMKRAGKAISKKAEKMFPKEMPLLVLCGPGNNGGDGFIAAQLLKNQGRDVRLALLGERQDQKGDAALAAQDWRDIVVPFNKKELEKTGGVIDALFGAGLTRNISGTPATMIEAINKSGQPVLAVDLPSGISGSSGQIQGIAVKADCTISFFRRKPGHILFPGRQYCGLVKIADIGIPTSVLDEIKPQVLVNDPGFWRSSYRVPGLTGHKYNRGHAVVVSGGADSTGAARLAAKAALRIGAGLVTLVCPHEALTINAAHLTAIMVRSFTDQPSFIQRVEDQHKNTVIIGPGTGVSDETRRAILWLLESDKALVLDADALTSFARHPEQLFQAIHKRKAPTILTPHDGEYQRLFGKLPPHEDNSHLSRLAKARHGADRSGAILVLKGPDTVIAKPGGQAVINDNAPAFLATAGAGDVLAGIIGGLLAQKMPAFEAACAAVWLHGDTAGDFGPGLISEDLPNLLPAALGKLGI
jgi:hydroxyethylthiazole kinase-like uncharacterized protein yjeF